MQETLIFGGCGRVKLENLIPPAEFQVSGGVKGVAKTNRLSKNPLTLDGVQSLSSVRTKK